MENVAIIFIIYLGITSVSLIFIAMKQNIITAACAIVGTFLLSICVVLTKSYFGPIYPTAIDVYRGNTKLEITYVDSVAVDTAVVWKNR